ncbi:hypothetical protein ACFW6V_39980 [Streptomyces sp. NPDC058734]|uniref:hypothetical protein n=1 Tax=Streptomyces sp. NPDC058734 TaxID=3346615 RepID=UPI0036760A7A
MMRRGVQAAAVAAVLVLAVTGSSCDEDDGGGDGGRPKPSADAKPTGGGGGTVKPTRTPSPTPSPRPTAPGSPTPAPEDKNTGHVRVDRTRPLVDYKTGVIRAACSALDIELTLSADHAPARWEAVALDYHPGAARYTDGNVPRGVVIEPAAGVVSPGGTRTVRVRGTFTGRLQRFWIVVQYPDFPQPGKGGTVRVTLPVECIR